MFPNQVNESSQSDLEVYKHMAGAIRALSMDAVEKAKSGHPGMPLGIADVATVLFKDFLTFSPQNPDWINRDRFILSAGHGSMLLYSLLHLTGYDDMTLDEIKNFRQLGAKTAGHPEYGHAKGIETTTGPLGQGLANSVGFALAERLMAERFGDEVIDHYTYVIAGDGCLMEGISQEAISLAGHLSLEKLIVLWDDNGISIDGPVSLSSSEDQIARFKACGWDVQEIDGHNPDEIYAAIKNAKETSLPSLIACKTVIGFGAPTKSGKPSSHGAPLGGEEIEGVRQAIGWDSAPFEIPEHVAASWNEVAQKGNQLFETWNEQHAEVSSEFDRVLSGKLPSDLPTLIKEIKQEYCDEQPKWATRKSSGEVLKRLSDAIPELIGGSADLTGSNLTKTSSQNPITRDDFSGNYVYYGIREHGMAAVMNGLALYGGLIPYGGTFMVFTDYCRPAIRLSALMGKRVIYVMTHDPIGLGEDGPTHQPVEHLASLRAMPNVNVIRPADAVETLEAWQVALESLNTPTVLSLTRQGVPAPRIDYTDENLTSKGAYILREAEGDLAVTLYASGSEVSIAMDAKTLLEEQNIGTRIVSVPCWDLFEKQSEEYQQLLTGNTSLKVAIEAASGFGWERFIGSDGIFVGMNSFGASAPADQLYDFFGITSKSVVDKVKARLQND
ncbi:MAG: transketolase [Rickettsiales bacterium]|nr:transketolase [Rickettsiales bacterium]